MSRSRRRHGRAGRAALFVVLCGVLLLGLPVSVPARAVPPSPPAGPESSPDQAPAVIVPSGAPAPPALTAASAVLLDVASGRVLYAKAGSVQRPPASLTKVMTALLALEGGGLDEPVEISEAAANVGGSSLWLAAGETQTLRDLLYGLLLRSGNDAAMAIAEHVAGNADDFALLMNRRAAAIGVTATHFRNPHGLPTSGHVSTATDLALIAREALLREDFRQIAATRRHVIPWPGQPWDRAVYNENRLLWLYPGADGVKTGWTEEAGRCLIASATREGWPLVAVLLDAPEMWTDATELLDWGFASFRCLELYAAGSQVSRVRVAGAAERWVPLAAGRSVRLAVLPGEEARIEVVPVAPSFVRSPLKAGTQTGSLRLAVDGVPLAAVPLVLAENVPPGGVVGRFVEDLWVLLLETLRRVLAPGATPDATMDATPEGAWGAARSESWPA